MATLTVWKKALCLLSLLPATALQAQNSSLAKQTDAWIFGIGTGASFGIKPTENTLFRSNSMATKMFGQYYFGHIGLGFSTGIVPGSISSTAVNQFLTERKFPADALQASSKPVNAYLLFGPAFSFGRQVKISAGINGGIFYNNPGSLTISQQGVTRPLYRFEADNKNIAAGLSGTISLAYPVNNSTRFFINTDYLQTQSGIRLLDPQRGIDVATSQIRTVKLFTAGAGIIKSLGSARDRVSGIATGKRSAIATNTDMARDGVSGIPTGKRIVTPRDPASGMATGKRIVTPRDPASGMPTGKRSSTAGGDNTQSCGPVTLKTILPDGTSSEQTFACPADALNYQRQTQGSTFGEKVNAGLHAAGGALAQGASKQQIVHRDIAARNILLGRVSWSGNSVPGIVTNQDAVSSVGGAGSGAAQASYARTAATGIQTTIHTREAGSGMATGRRQYQPVFFEGNANGTACNDCAASVIVNPLYVDKGQNGTNPMNKSQGGTTTGNATTMEGLKVYLVDAATETAIAVTQTEANGDFWFANVPSGNYVVQISGNFLSKKGYDVYLKNKGSYDVAGEMLLANDFWSVTLETAEGTAEQAAAVIKTKTKSNQSNDRAANSNEEPLVWSPRSNKTMPVTLTDVDGDGVAVIVAGASLLGGALPGGAVISAAMRPGTPIGGIIVKGGKNPGGLMRTVTSNEYGEFEFTGWTEGNYTISADISYVINDETFVRLGDDFNDGNSSMKTTVPKQTQGTTFGEKVNAGLQINNSGMPNRISMNVTVPKQTQGATFGEKVNTGVNKINITGMPNRISMNVTVPKQTQGATFGEKVNNSTGNNPTTRAQNNNTVRSNRIDNAIVIADLDGDGEMESSYLNFNGEVAVINIAPLSNGKVKEKATSGLKDVIKTQVRTGAPVGPVKWMAPEINRTQIWGDPHVDEKDGTRLLLNNGNGQAVNDGNWKTIPVTVKAVTCADGSCAIITAAPGDFSATSSIALRDLPATPVADAAVWFTDAKGTIYKTTTDENGSINLDELPTASSLRMLVNFGVAAGDDIIITFSTNANGKSISNVLKTKHDTAKNSVGNIR